MKSSFFILSLTLAFFFVGSVQAQPPVHANAQVAQATKAKPTAKAPTPTTPAAPAAAAATATAPKGPRVAMDTNKGTIILELDPVKAPITVKNFLDYVKAGYYQGTIFHRIISSFMIQGGGYTADYRKKDTREPIKLEAGNGLSNLRGTVAMARTQIRDSATSQFFINVVDNLRLDSYGGGYAVFGKVIKGIEVVDAIRYVPTRPHSGQPNAPVEPVIINKITLLP